MRLAIGAAVAIVAAVTLVLVITSLGGRKPAGHPAAIKSTAITPTPVASSPQPPPGPWEYIGARSTDPDPLTLRELFPASFGQSGVAYYRTAATKSPHCVASIIGAALQAAVQKAGCSQVIRATYLSRAVKMMATIGVLNLKSFAAATTAARAAGRSDFIAQLPAKTGPTHQIGNGTGIEIPVVKGHYLILVWAEFMRLHAPKTSVQRQDLGAFMNLLVTRTANVSLSYRMVDGKPSPPAQSPG